MKKRTGGFCAGRRNTRGESMVIAVILMLFFLVIGVSMITAASQSNATINQRVAQRKAYYLARSTLDTLDESLQHGELGAHIRAQAYQQLGNPGETVETTQVGGTLSPVLTLPATLPADGYELVDCVITYEGIARRTVSRNGDGTIREQSAVLGLEDVTCTFTAKFKESEYHLSVSYSLEAAGEWISGEDWRWADTWTVKTVS